MDPEAEALCDVALAAAAAVLSDVIYGHTGEFGENGVEILEVYYTNDELHLVA